MTRKRKNRELQRSAVATPTTDAAPKTTGRRRKRDTRNVLSSTTGTAAAHARPYRPIPTVEESRRNNEPYYNLEHPEDYGPKSPGETVANILSTVLCGAYIGYTSRLPTGIISFIIWIAKVILGGFIAGQFVQMAFGILCGVYYTYIRKIPFSQNSDYKADEINALLFPESGEARVVHSRRSCEVDSLIYPCADLDDGIQTIYKLTGVKPKKDGSMNGLGLRCALLSLGDCAYLRIIAPDPDQPKPDWVKEQQLPYAGFGGTSELNKLISFSVHPTPGTRGATIELISQAMHLAGYSPGIISSGDRHSNLPFGFGEVLHRKFTSPFFAQGWKPFLVDCLVPPTRYDGGLAEGSERSSPAMTAPKGCKLVKLTFFDSNRKEVNDFHCKIGLIESRDPSYHVRKYCTTNGTRVKYEYVFCTGRVKVETKETDGARYMEAELETPKGLITL